MSHTSQPLAALALAAAFVAYTASASPIHRAQYEVYNDQQAAPRDELQTVANQQTPSELQSHGAHSSQEQPQANEQPASSEQKSEQASTPPPAPDQPNAFVSGKSNEPQDVAQTEPQREQSTAPVEQDQKSSEPPQSQPTAPSAETKSGEEYNPYNP